MFRKNIYIKILNAIFAVIGILFVIRFLIIAPAKIYGDSMEPNYHDQQNLFINKFIYLFKEPQRFDVIEIMEPNNNKIMIKRIIGLPNEIITLKGEKIYIQSNRNSPPTLLEEPYLKEKKDISNEPSITYTIGSYSYFILGDNRNESTDSRVYGAINRKNILGKIINF